MRRPTQITVSARDENSDAIYALCDDGSIWMLYSQCHHNKPRWTRLPDIPDERATDG
jgi:hypothetical protein